jgi:hypothetical protein
MKMLTAYRLDELAWRLARRGWLLEGERREWAITQFEAGRSTVEVEIDILNGKDRECT